ncbi:patatin-like protein [Actinopolymorpha pittospori]
MQATELRLALVCYGGVSLAIYMHGVTKELHKLVRASRVFDTLEDLDGPNPFTAAGTTADTEAAYFEALRSLAKAGRRLSVSIDIIAGTSAGGINGVVLAKAIARNADQEHLKRLWLDEGDLKKLLRAPRIAGLRTRAVLALARQLVMMSKPTSPLRGERLSQLLLVAMNNMDHGSAHSTLLPERGTLELFITTTDLHGFEVVVPSGVGGASQRDRYHAQVLEFRTGQHDTSVFGPLGTPALAFAARATSSFPGAFAPVSLQSFADEGGTPVAETADLFRYQYDEHGLRAHDAWFVDGGVLDNAPFDHVIDAIRRRSAQTEVLRRIIYIQPDPDQSLTTPVKPESPAAAGWLAGLWQTAGVMGSHPILLELLKLRDMNWRIAQVGAIADSQMSEVLAEMRRAVAIAGLSNSAGDDGDTANDDPAGVAPTGDIPALAGIDSREHVKAVSDAMHQRAETVLGPSWATYQRLKVEAAGRRLADEIAKRFVFPPDSGRSSFIRAAIGAWARARPEWADPEPAQLVALLGPVDIPYRERRLMFLLAGVNGLYGREEGDAPGPPREDLDQLKQEAWRLLEDLQTVPREVVAAVPDKVIRFLTAESIDARLLDNPELFAAEHAEDFSHLFEHYRQELIEKLGDGSTPLWKIYERETQGWNSLHRIELLGRYLGFPLWDGIIFPTISLAELPQFTPIGVAQFSPLTASVLPTPPGGKLKGVTLHHFGAFLASAWRENDYLWGRLDGAELILRTLHEGQTTTQQEPGGDLAPEPAQAALHAAGAHHLIAALQSVLATEHGLDGIRGLRSDIEEQVAALAASLPPDAER